MPPTNPHTTIFPTKRKDGRTRTSRKAIRAKARPSNAEKTLVDQIVRDIPHAITESQVTALSNLLERPRATIKQMIEQARERFVESAGRYVDVHMQATEGALAGGDHETAAKAAQWALTNISGEGARVVDRAEEGMSPPKVLIGIKLGGLERDTRINATATEIAVMDVDALP